jgi:cytochrome c oxidase subunit 2
VKKRSLILLVIVPLLSACGFIGSQNIHAPSTSVLPNEASVANGRQIYFTATDQDGQVIPYTGGPEFGGMMMGGYYSCASCHGEDGHGGTHYMHMTVMDAPDITYPGLIQMKQEDSGGNPSEYSLADLRGAVVEGHDTAGQTLDQDMPRWQMSDQNLADLLAFLKTLP